jgi:hypothetical protein
MEGLDMTVGPGKLIDLLNSQAVRAILADKLSGTLLDTETIELESFRTTLVDNLRRTRWSILNKDKETQHLVTAEGRRCGWHDSARLWRIRKFDAGESFDIVALKSQVQYFVAACEKANDEPNADLLLIGGLSRLDLKDLPHRRPYWLFISQFRFVHAPTKVCPTCGSHYGSMQRTGAKFIGFVIGTGEKIVTADWLIYK